MGERPWIDTDQQQHHRSVAGYYLTAGFPYLLVFNCEMNNFSGALEHILNKVRLKCGPLSLPSFHPFSLSLKNVFCSHNSSSFSPPSLLISLIRPCFFFSLPSPPPSVLSSVCSSVICSKGLGVG